VRIASHRTEMPATIRLNPLIAMSCSPRWRCHTSVNPTTTPTTPTKWARSHYVDDASSQSLDGTLSRSDERMNSAVHQHPQRTVARVVIHALLRPRHAIGPGRLLEPHIVELPDFVDNPQRVAALVLNFFFSQSFLVELNNFLRAADF
jgi:hypothetical protein